MKNVCKVTIIGMTILFVIMPLYGRPARLGSEQITEWSRVGEFLIDTNIVFHPADGDEHFPAVAFDGTNYLVVWCHPFYATYGIHGARVDQSGNILDPWITISILTEGCPSVAFDGTNYLVVWQDLEICGYRVDQSGNVLDPWITISTGHGVAPSVAFGGSNYLVVWEQDSDIYGARIDQSGNVLDTMAIVISTAGGATPAIAFDGLNYLVVWEQDSDIYGARIDQSGSVLDDGIAISTASYAQVSPSVTFDGTNYLVVWEDSRSGSYSDIYGARIDIFGTVLDSSGISISTAAYSQRSPSVAFDSTNYLIVWQDERSGYSDIYGARVDEAGNVIDPAGLAISIAVDYQGIPSVASDGTNCLAVWQDERSGDLDIYGSRVDQAGNVLDPTGINISIIPNHQEEPSVAFDGTNYLAVWQDKRGGYYFYYGSSDIYGSRVDQFGGVLDTTSIDISTAANNQLNPAVASDGTNYLVVWEDCRATPYYPDIYCARVDASGNVLDPTGIAIAPTGYQLSPAVAFGETDYMVVWWQEGGVYGARVNAAGTVLDTTGIAISTTGWNPSVAFGGTNYLVVWEDGRSGNPPPDIYGARVDQSGNVLDTAGIAISTTGGAAPAIAFDGTNYLVVWEDYRSGYYPPPDIYGARVDQSGNVLDTAGIAIATTLDLWGGCPSVAFDGTNYLVVWEHDFDIYGAKLNTSGVVIGSFAVSIQAGDQISPSLTHGMGDQLLITYSGWAGQVGNNTYNAMRIWGKFYPFVGVEEDEEFTINDTRYSLMVYPNPFTQQTKIRFTIHDTRYVIQEATLRIYDTSGRLVKSFNPESCIPGLAPRSGAGMDHASTISWDGTDQANRQLPSGVYFLKLQAGNHKETKKLILLR